MIRTLIRGATMAGLVSFAVLAFAPNYTLADEWESLSSAPVVPSLSIAERGFQVAQGKKGGGGGGGKTCPTGYADCDGNKSNKCEVNLQTDINNCGGCGQKCGSFPNATSACTNGSCQIASCASGYSDCDKNPSNGCETFIQGNDANNCGACGQECPSPVVGTAACTGGTCEITCATGYVGGTGEGCMDIDECSLGTNDCKPDEACINEPGTYSCVPQQ